MAQSLSSWKLSASCYLVRKYSYSPRKRLGIKNSGFLTYNIIIIENPIKIQEYNPEMLY